MTNRPLTILTGASRGMGLAIARQILSSQGLLLCISRRTNPVLDSEAAACGAELIPWSHDLADALGARERVQGWLEQQDPHGFTSATLINNAAVIPQISPLADCPPDQLANALRVGLEAPMQLTAAFLKVTSSWVAQGWRGPRKVLNISSGLGRHAMASQAPYCAAKAGLDHFTRCCALEEARREHGAKLVSLAPGMIDTDMQRELRSSDPAAFPDRQRFLDLNEKGHLATPEAAAARIIAHLQRPNFGENVIADVRDA